MTLTTDINSYNSAIKTQIPEWGKGIPKLGIVSVICILFSCPLGIFNTQNSVMFTENRNNLIQTINNSRMPDNNQILNNQLLNNGSSLFIMSILRNSNLFNNNNQNTFLTLIKLLIYIVNILYEAIFWVVPDNISTLDLYSAPFYNLDILNSLETFGWITVSLLIFKNVLLNGGGLDSLLFGLGSGNRKNYLSSVNFWFTFATAYYYSNYVKASYNNFYTELSNKSPGGLGDVVTAITDTDVENKLYDFLKSASNISLISSSNLYFTLLEIVSNSQNNTTINNINNLNNLNSQNNTEINNTNNSNSQNMGGGIPKNINIQEWPNNFDI